MSTTPGNDVMYAKCACGSGEKYKFCCYKKDKNVASETKGELNKLMSRSLGILNAKLAKKRQLSLDNKLHIDAVQEAIAEYEKDREEEKKTETEDKKEV